MPKLMIVVGAAIAAISLPSVGWSQSQPMQYGYPVVSPQINGDDLPCYMTTNNARTLNLGRLCGSVPVSSPTTYRSFSNGNNGSSGIRNRSSGSSGSGICNTPDDIARDGSRCGGRAASERPGGNNSNGSSSTFPSLEPSQFEPTRLAPTRNISIDNPSSSGTGSSNRTCSVNSFSSNGGSAVGYSYRC